MQVYNEADFIDYSNLQARTMTTDTSDQIVQRIVFNEIPVQGKHSETFPAHAKLNKKQLSEIKEQLFFVSFENKEWKWRKKTLGVNNFDLVIARR